MNNLRFLLPVVGFFLIGKSKAQDTFSIVALDSVTGEVGSAGASCVDLFNTPMPGNDFLAELFPGVGAIVTQAAYDETNQKNARNRMNMGETPKQIIDWLVANDVSSNPGSRQYGVVGLVNGKSQSAGHTGSGNSNYKNHLTGPNYSIQGNILRGSEVLDSMEARFLRAEGNLACKLMAAMQGANMVGADSRCKSNGTSSLFAFLKVAQPADDFGSPSLLLSLRTRNGAKIEPIDSLQVLFNNASINCKNTTAISKNNLSESYLTIYPNPSNTKINISLLAVNQSKFALEIKDITGAMVYKGQFADRSIVDVSQWGKGVYFIHVSAGNVRYVKKFVKN